MIEPLWEIYKDKKFKKSTYIIDSAQCGACGCVVTRVNLTASQLKLCKCANCDTIGSLEEIPK